MNEKPFNPGDNPAEVPPAQDAVWRSETGDIPVKVHGHILMGGVEYAIIEKEDGTEERVPASELDLMPLQSEQKNEPEYGPEETTFEPGQDVSLWKKGKLQEGWVVDEQDQFSTPDMVKIKRKDGTMSGTDTYAPIELLVPAGEEPTKQEAQQEEVAEDVGELATEQVVEPSENVVPEKEQQEPDVDASEDTDSPSKENALSPEAEDNPPETSPWFEPRLILELKQKYAAKLANHAALRQRLNDKTSEHYKDILLTQVIEEAISNRINKTEWLRKKGNLGEERRPGFEPMSTQPPERPSKAIIQRMAAMIDQPESELTTQAVLQEEEAAKKHLESVKSQYEFAVGDEVKHVNQGEVEEGWIVKEVKPTHSGNYFVLAKDGESERVVKRDKLVEEQDWQNTEDINGILKKLRPYFNQKVKIKSGDEIIEGTFQGYSTKSPANKGVYIGDAHGRRFLDAQGKSVIIPVEEFLSWQTMDTQGETVEELAEEQADDNDSDSPDENESSNDTEQRDGDEDNEKAAAEVKKTEQELSEWNKLSDKEKGDKAVAEWWRRVEEKWEKQGLTLRIITGTMGLLAVGGALSTVPGWPISYGVYRAHRARLLKKMNIQKEKAVEE